MSYSKDITVVIEKTNHDGIGNVLKGFISCYSVHENTVIECNPDYVYGNYDSILVDKHIYKYDPLVKPEYAYTSRLVVTREEEINGQQNIVNEYTQTNGCGNHLLNCHFFSNYVVDYNYNPDLLIDLLKCRVWNTIDKIQFNPIIHDEVLKTCNIIPFKTENVLGISIRTWKCHHELNVIIERKYDPDLYKSTITSVIINNPKIDTIILSVDNPDYITEYSNFLLDFNKKVLLLTKPSHINELQFALIKAKVLSKCNFFIGSRISTFSELVFWFSKCKIKVFPIG